jgi:hypothetical protein
MSEDRRQNVLARIVDTPQLAGAVPRLQPELLHAVITHCGLADCSELLALATVEQLSAVFDLDLWKAARPGAAQQFDAARFCEWLEVLVDGGAALAAHRLASMEPGLVVAGLSSQIRVFDAAVFSPGGEPSGADVAANAFRERNLHVEIGGYLVVARQPDSWNAIVDVLLALHEDDDLAFHRLMHECRRLTNTGFELDGLDDLLTDQEQTRFDLASSREQRRDRLGFVTPEEARAFLETARRLRFEVEPPPEHLVSFRLTTSAEATAVKKAEATAVGADATDLGEIEPGIAEIEWPEEPVADAAAVTGVIEMLRAAGVLAESPRALLESGRDQPVPINAALNEYLRLQSEDDAEWAARNGELAFLGNVLMSGCSVNGRSFTRREAVDAAAATCNLGLECWPAEWGAVARHDLVTVFQVGWTTLYRKVSLAVVDRVLAALEALHTPDTDLQRELYVLRREVLRQRRAGTPWRARPRLEVLAALDLPAWAALSALLDECPVMLANVTATPEKPPRTVDPFEFQFAGSRGDILAVDRFLAGLTELLTR